MPYDFEIMKKTPNTSSLPVFLFLSILFAILAVYYQVYQFDFVYYDDHIYVTDNIHLHSGFSKKSVFWALTSDEAGFWHPLTWFSLILDYELYGLNPGGYHGTNLLLHMANTVLLFVVLWTMTVSRWRSCFVTALFALHPLHVEPVAWIADRKDLLSTFFWMLTLWAYVSYVRRPGMSRYALVFIFFTLGLMSKPMLVTLPFVLLLIDFWPLQRVAGIAQQEGKVSSIIYPSPFFRLLLEKMPFLILAIMISIITILAEGKAGALKPLDLYPLDVRVTNALVSYVAYMGKTVWPTNLAVYYPHPGMSPLWQIIFSAGILLIITGLCFMSRKRLPYLIVGWLWFLGTLVPVIGLVQIGSHAMADRYTYIPLIGLFIMFAWGMHEIMNRLHWNKIFCSTSMAALVLILASVSWIQVQYWQNATTLFRHAVAVTKNSFLGHNNLGAALARKGQIAEAVYHYQEALKVKPDYAEAYFNMGSALAHLCRYGEAIWWYEKALQYNPLFVEAYNNKGIACAQTGKITEAIACFQTALRLKPGYTEARRNMDIALRQPG